MLLILEITSTAGDVMRHTFREEGGSIGRESDNSLVLPHPKVSSLHALITCRNNAYYIEDRSRNGVCINSRKNRIPRDRPTALNAGDRVLIDPYDIRISVGRESDATPGSWDGRRSPVSSPTRQPPLGFDPANPFETDDPFAQDPLSDSPRSDDPETGELDPIKLLKLGKKSEPPRRGPTARDLQEASLLEEHYKPPAVVYEPPPTPPATIPEDYDPLADDGFQEAPNAGASRDRLRSQPIEPIALPVEPVDRPAVTPVVERAVAPVPSRPVPPAPERPFVAPLADVPASPRDPDAADQSGPAAATIDLGAVFAGAGLDPSLVTPAVARDFGAILRIVVSGVMDVMRSRQQIKDEFRMAGTRVRPIDNNPLKFSADVDDALHNLLVKRNRAYLTPVEAFADAFDDLRRHQMAMLAGVRAAFEATLEAFEPDYLQQEFDRQGGKGLVPAKLRYWDLYRDAHRALTKDPETTFRRLFGEHFARAYEDQLKALKAADSRSGTAPAASKQNGE